MLGAFAITLHECVPTRPLRSRGHQVSTAWAQVSNGHGHADSAQTRNGKSRFPVYQKSALKVGAVFDDYRISGPQLLQRSECPDLEKLCRSAQCGHTRWQQSNPVALVFRRSRRSPLVRALIDSGDF